MGESLQNPEERLYRQIHPGSCPEGVIQSNAFFPPRKHKYRLSMDRSTKVSAGDSYKHHTQTKQVAVVAEVLVLHFSADDPSASCPVIDDPNPPEDPDNDAHCYADFSGLSQGQRRHRAKLLKTKATVAYRPTPAA